MVWRVKEWVDARPRPVDPESLRQALIREVAAWSAVGRDGNYGAHLRQGFAIKLLALDRENGVRVEKFPKLWVCKACDRVHQSNQPARCSCGSTRFGQLPFVSYHDQCGALRTPFLRTCPVHREVKVIFPGTARAEEIRFVCPVCSNGIQNGFGFLACDCGAGRWSHNVHRAASVFTPRTVVMINPPTPEKVAQVRAAGGPSQALSWMLGGLREVSFEQVGTTPDSFKANLVAQGIAEPLANQMLQMAIASGNVSAGGGPVNLDPLTQETAKGGAVSVALALLDSRLRIEDLVQKTDPNSELGLKYRNDYPTAIRCLGLEDIELIDSFPVLTGTYGYTRGDATPGATRLVPYKDRQGNYVVYGEVIRTEALFVRLDPCRVADWLVRAGCALDSWTDARSARLAILRAATLPGPGSNAPQPPTPGSKLLTLVHSLSHWFIRQLAVHAGIERTSLAEFLVPQHCSFFLYAATRGDFVLGGLQAVFESELDTFLKELASSDLRCALDPGCKRVAGACVACLHLGEPSCRYYNTYLSRQSLVGPGGYRSLGNNA